MIDQAEKCHWNGGRVYGYKLAPVLDPVKLDQYGQSLRIGTRLVIDPEQARWVKQIFEWYVDGWSAIKIVTELNRLNVPSPGAAYRTRRVRSGWNFLALHGELSRGTGLLNNRLYTGVYTWNRSYRAEDPDTGRTVNRWRDKSEWIERAMPELRIVSDDLWALAHERRTAVSQGVAALRASERCRARSTGRRPKYLLSGLLTCGLCRKPFVVCEATKYGCSTVTRQGIYRCANTLRVERTLAEALLLEPIKTSLFTEEGYAAFHQDLMTALAHRRHMQVRTQDQAAARLATLDLEIKRLLAAIKAGTFSPSLQQALEAAERERVRLGQDHDIAPKPHGAVPAALPDVGAWFRRAVGDLAMLGPHQVDKARGIIKDLVGGSIPLTPTETSDGPALTATLKPDYAGLIKRLVEPKIILVAVTRIERVTRGL
ncbi:MAG: recombinase family protein [Nitrospira sp.]|nr:recombinase family protein [Nitrospira sp.]